MKPAHKLQTFDQLVYMQRTDPFIKTIIQSVYTEHYHLLNENMLHLYQVNFGYPMEILLTVLVAVSAFVATNLDDLFVLTLFFAGKDFNNTSVVVGQYIGVSLLMIIGLFFQIYNTHIIYCFIRNSAHCYRIEKSMEFKKEWLRRPFK